MPRCRTATGRALVVLCLILPAATAAQSPKPMSIVDLIDVPRLSDPNLSPDGRQLLFVRSDADWKANKRVSHVWRAVVGTGELTQMTAGEDGESSPRWSPDGRTIAFLAKRGTDEATQIYLLGNAGGEARRLTGHATAAGNIAWAPDGSAIYFTAPEADTPEEKARDKAKDDIYAFDEDFKQVHLWRAAVADGAATRITSGDFSVTAYRVSRDGRRIAHHRMPTPLFGDSERGEVWLMDAGGSNAVRLTDNGTSESGAELSPDGTQVLFLAGVNARFETYHNQKAVLVPAAGGAPRLVTPADLAYEVERATWSKDGAAIYFTANTGVETQLFVMPASGGAPKALTAGRHTLTGWDYDPEAGLHVFGKDEPANPGDFHLLRSEGGLQRITNVYENLPRDFALPAVEAVSWRGADGVTVEGLLYLPVGHEAGRRYPLVVQTHGGPAASDKFAFGSWSSYTQVLTGKGYAVLKPNYRGSTGYGDPFLRDMVGHYFKNAHLDVMAGVDHLIAKGIADPERLVKMGWSAGGHMTNKIITFTDRFKAASSGAGAANWVSMYGQSDVRSYRTPWFGGSPWQADAPVEVYWEHSPLKYVSKVKTPTIFIVGEKDVRVPVVIDERNRILDGHQRVQGGQGGQGGGQGGGGASPNGPGGSGGPGGQSTKTKGASTT